MDGVFPGLSPELERSSLKLTIFGRPELWMLPWLGESRVVVAKASLALRFLPGLSVCAFTLLNGLLPRCEDDRVDIVPRLSHLNEQRMSTSLVAQKVQASKKSVPNSEATRLRKRMRRSAGTAEFRVFASTQKLQGNQATIFAKSTPQLSFQSLTSSVEPSFSSPNFDSLPIVFEAYTLLPTDSRHRYFTSRALD